MHEFYAVWLLKSLPLSSIFENSGRFWCKKCLDVTVSFSGLVNGIVIDPSDVPEQKKCFPSNAHSACLILMQWVIMLVLLFRSVQVFISVNYDDVIGWTNAVVCCWQSAVVDGPAGRPPLRSVSVLVVVVFDRVVTRCRKPREVVRFEIRFLSGPGEVGCNLKSVVEKSWNET